MMQEAAQLLQSALPIAASYDHAEPGTPKAEHYEFDATLKACVLTAMQKARRCSRRNDDSFDKNETIFPWCTRDQDAHTSFDVLLQM